MRYTKSHLRLLTDREIEQQLEDILGMIQSAVDAHRSARTLLRRSWLITQELNRRKIQTNGRTS